MAKKKRKNIQKKRKQRCKSCKRYFPRDQFTLAIHPCENDVYIGAACPRCNTPIHELEPLELEPDELALAKENPEALMTWIMDVAGVVLFGNVPVTDVSPTTPDESE